MDYSSLSHSHLYYHCNYISDRWSDLQAALLGHHGNHRHTLRTDHQHDLWGSRYKQPSHQSEYSVMQSGMGKAYSHLQYPP